MYKNQIYIPSKFIDSLSYNPMLTKGLYNLVDKEHYLLEKYYKIGFEEFLHDYFEPVTCEKWESCYELKEDIENLSVKVMQKIMFEKEYLGEYDCVNGTWRFMKNFKSEKKEIEKQRENY